MTSVQNIPKFEVTFDNLPSRGIGYPENAKIYYRGYTVGELNKIASVKEESLTFDFILKSSMEGIETDNIDKLDLSYIDILSLGLRRRVSSEGDLKFKMPYMCAGCKKPSSLIFSHSDINFNSIAENVKIDGVDHELKLPIKAAIKGTECEFWYPTARNMLDSQFKKGKEKISALRALTVRNLDFVDAYKLLSELNEISDIEDIETLEIIDKALYHDISSIESVCKNEIVDSETDQKGMCNHTSKVSVEGKELLIRPFREHKTPTGNKVRFGN